MTTSPAPRLGLPEQTVRTLVPARAETDSVLVVKIAAAAASLGYSSEDVRKVAGLVGANVGTSAGTATGNDDFEDRVREALGRLLDGADGTPALRVNSNEPVLLVNAWGGYDKLRLEALVSQLVGQLRRDYGIRPVRVYMGDYVVGADAAGKGFSVSVLNVVNTEIGGPSMIQLLDASGGGNAKVTKEEWEQSDGSVERTVELAMRNWNVWSDSLGHAEATDLESTKKDIGDNRVELTEDLEQEVKDDVLQSKMEQHCAGIDQSMDLDKRTSSAAREDDEDEDAPEIEIVGTRERDKDASSHQDSFELQQPSLESVEMYKLEAAEDAIIEDERKEAMNGETGEAKESGEHVGSTDTVAPPASSEDDFEVVDRKRTLIDMVFGHEK